MPDRMVQMGRFAAAHCAPRAALVATAGAAGEPLSPLLRSRLQTHAAMATTLQRAQEARGGVAGTTADAGGTGDDFNVFN